MSVLLYPSEQREELACSHASSRTWSYTANWQGRTCSGWQRDTCHEPAVWETQGCSQRHLQLPAAILTDTCNPCHDCPLNLYLLFTAHDPEEAGNVSLSCSVYGRSCWR